LTLAGARRRLVEESLPVAPNTPAIDELIGRNARERLTEVKRGLRSILDLLAGRIGTGEFHLAPPATEATQPRPRVAIANRRPSVAPAPARVSPRPSPRGKSSA
jgi:hypothetical protein